MKYSRWQLVLFAVSALVYFPFSQWVSTTRIGTTLFLFGQMVYLLPLLGAIVGLPILVVFLCFPGRRKDAAFYLLLSIVFILCCVAGIRVGQKIRMAGMR